MAQVGLLKSTSPLFEPLIERLRLMNGFGTAKRKVHVRKCRRAMTYGSEGSGRILKKVIKPAELQEKASCSKDSALRAAYRNFPARRGAVRSCRRSRPLKTGFSALQWFQKLCAALKGLTDSRALVAGLCWRPKRNLERGANSRCWK